MEKSRKGFVPVMLMPFQNDGQVDYQALTKLTELYLAAGASGLFANCLSSEMFELTPAEMLKTIRHVVDLVAGAVPVVATGTFGGPIGQQADFVKQVHDAGTEAVIAITGLLATATQPDAYFNDQMFQLLELTPGIPLGFYECPVPYKRVLAPEQLKAFVETGRVIYHKDTCLDLGQVRQKIAATTSYKFGLYDAYMGHAVDSLKAGAAGLSCIQGNFYPELIVWLCQHYDDASRADEVRAVAQFFVHNMDVMHHVYPIVAKYSLKQRGIDISTFTRRKVGNFSSETRKNIEKLDLDYAQLHKSLAYTG
ncbi:dihydrodipicolinate synthase family protein [Hymenobacter sp. BT559]|uniref:dihydrodipicolinate synthase family protein n=1 Tax=Hymenobacter sp. BT559 TaxID=2795729 RepID=UPI0018EB3266|nr:dihydrodipicolinate synthase family protein [Hymenobacter sp. BT559]MBJ6145318.1 dihydrodipicolinate synthase family protein [Hymenobacter sp. BT559]